MKPKNIVITGATSGIGEATTRLLHQSGHHLFLIARNEAKLETLKSELGGHIHVFAADVKDYERMKTAMETAVNTMGTINVLISNAGMGVFDQVVNGRIEDWHEMVDVNVKGLLNGLHAALPFLVKVKGHVINLGSVASHHVFANSGIYCATKHAVFAISESLRIELPDKIRVTTISPGSVNTAFIDQTKSEAMLKDYKPYFAAGMTPEWIAENIRYAIEAPENTVVSEIVVRPNRAVR